MKTKRSISMVCGIVATLCFGIASVVSFCHGRQETGWIFALLSAAQLVLAVTGYFLSKKADAGE